MNFNFKDFINKSRKKIDNNLKNIYSRKNTPIIFYFILLILYTIVSILLTQSAKVAGTIPVFGQIIPYGIFTGVFSSIANICIILLVVLFGKLGFITSMIILLGQFPILIVNLVIIHTPNSIPGIFTNIFTIISIICIYLINQSIQKFQEKLRKQAITDGLTGLPNRLAAMEYMNKFIKKNERFALVSVDLTNFKRVNDSVGHDIGDKILIEIANRWKNLADSLKTGTSDFIARLGGDEYAIIIRNYSSSLEILSSLNMYEEELERKITINNYDYYVRASFGFAEFPFDAETSINLFSCADAALHKVQRANTNYKILRFTSELLQLEQNAEIEQKLRQAIENEAIECFLQPQYDIAHKLCGFEALARIKDTDGTFISPSVFIPIAEKAGLIDRVDVLVFKKAAKFLAEIIAEGNNDIIMSTNISVRHMMKSNFIDEIKSLLKLTNVPANRIKIEITESIMIDFNEKAVRCINEIKELGMKIAIDDFGTGYSSLSYLQKFPADMLKIDKSFIDVMNTSDASKKYVATIISIGHILNLEVISEGVESPDQLDTLQETGCDYIQGYIWGRPMPLEEAKKLIAVETGKEI